jgi:hypothetical protein
MSADFVLVKFEPEQFETKAKQWEETTCLWQQAYEMSEGEINMWKYGRVSIAALDLWRKTALQYHPDDIGEIEGAWLMRANNGPATHCDLYVGLGYEYDFVSFYPAIMMQTDFHIPLTEPTFEILPENYFDDPKAVDSYGVYRCTIEGDSFLFIHQRNDHFTHFCIKTARER